MMNIYNYVGQEQLKEVFRYMESDDLTFVKDEKILPSSSGFDGFYMALLKKNI